MREGPLAALARAWRKPVEACEHYQPNVGEWAHQRVRKRVRGHRATVFASASSVVVELKGLETSACFALGTPDRICGMNEPLEIDVPDLRLPLFTSPSERRAASAWLLAPGHAWMLARQRVRAGEALHVYRNAVVLTARHDRATGSCVEALCDLADRLRVEPVAARGG